MKNGICCCLRHAWSYTDDLAPVFEEGAGRARDAIHERLRRTNQGVHPMKDLGGPQDHCSG